ncbi:MAG: TetR/AcrR family transcriptional regulator [Clostridiales bacterium]|jgi:AcrR family transcriptional regulator|nr:TetR/AcrR family transcriptional regulator [Clostridiales bacterium]
MEITGRKKQVTHAKVLHTAKVLFEKKGINHTTIDDIAIGSGLARSTYFTHFNSLDELYAELAEREIADLLEVAETSRNAGNPDKEVLRGIFYRLIEDTAKYPKAFIELLIRGTFFTDGSGEEFKGLMKLEAIVTKILDTTVSFKNKTLGKKELYAVLIGLYFGMVFVSIAQKETTLDTVKIKRAVDKQIELLF